MKRGITAQNHCEPTGVQAPADRASSTSMSRSMTHSGEPEHESTDPPGYHLGTDGGGIEHYYQPGTRRVTIDDGEDRETVKIPQREKALIDWCIHTVEQHEEAWREVAVDEPFRSWLTGEVPVGEYPDGEDA